MSEEKCSYCNDPHPACDCCYFDADQDVWVEQKLESNYSKTHCIEDFFSDVVVVVRPVKKCPECGRTF